MRLCNPQLNPLIKTDRNSNTNAQSTLHPVRCLPREIFWRQHFSHESLPVPLVSEPSLRCHSLLPRFPTSGKKEIVLIRVIYKVNNKVSQSNNFGIILFHIS